LIRLCTPKNTLTKLEDLLADLKQEDALFIILVNAAPVYIRAASGSQAGPKPNPLPLPPVHYPMIWTEREIEAANLSAYITLLSV
jgi:hypothetical protein